MAERHRSKDGSRDTEKLPGEAGGISQQGRDGGTLTRKVGAHDELKRATERPAGATRVRGSDTPEDKEGRQ